MKFIVVLDGEEVVMAEYTKKVHGGRAYGIVGGDGVVATIHTFPAHFKFSGHIGDTFRTGGHEYTIKAML